jgi:maltooligosyltrehalose synthase
MSINYRRFTIADLVGVRVKIPGIESTHGYILRLIEVPLIADHIDGRVIRSRM